MQPVVLNCILSLPLFVLIILSGNLHSTSRKLIKSWRVHLDEKTVTFLFIYLNSYIEQAASDVGIAGKRVQMKMIQSGVDFIRLFTIFICLLSSQGSESDKFVKVFFSCELSACLNFMSLSLLPFTYCRNVVVLVVVLWKCCRCRL